MGFCIFEASRSKKTDGFCAARMGLAAMTGSDCDVLDRVMSRLGSDGLAYSVRLHPHPDVEARLDMGVSPSRRRADAS